MLHPNIEKSYSENRSKALNQKGVSRVSPEFEVKENYAKQTIAKVSGKEFLNNPTLHHEVFGPYSIVVQCQDMSELESIIKNLEGQLTGTIVAEESEFKDLKYLVKLMSNKVGRLIFNGVPTGVEVTKSMTHGGPYPASTDSRFTAVGDDAIKRWLRPITYQNFPDELLK